VFLREKTSDERQFAARPMIVLTRGLSDLEQGTNLFCPMISMGKRDVNALRQL
jgi:hypothetical protein